MKDYASIAVIVLRLRKSDRRFTDRVGSPTSGLILAPVANAGAVGQYRSRS
jgi:hypothetical protein